MGTTLVAAVLRGNRAELLNVGDSRAYLVGRRHLQQITRDHSYVADLVESGSISPQQAAHHPNRNLITRAVGVDERVEPDLYSVTLKPGQYLLLCSDGLSNLVTRPEMLYEITHGQPGEAACRRMIDIANRRGSPDNVTAVLLQA